MIMFHIMGLIEISLFVFSYMLNDIITYKYIIIMNKCIIYASPRNQLGNCLRNISSTYIIAKYYSLIFAIDIGNMTHAKEKRIIKNIFSQFCKNNVNYLKLNANDGIIKFNHRYITNYDLICEGRFNCVNINKNFSITNSIYSIIPGNMTIETFIKEKINFYKLMNLGIIHNDINIFTNKYNVNEYVGVHIRAMDNLRDINKNKHNLNTPINILYDKIMLYIDKNNKLLICSDNTNVLNNLKNNNKIINNENIIFANNCSNNDFQGLYEMYLLSKTKLIIGSTASTFSYESAFFEGTDIELYENDNWKLYEISKYKQ